MHHWGLHPTQPVTSQARDPRKPSPTLREDLPDTRTRALQGSQCKQPLAALLTYHREPLLIMIDGSPDRALRLGACRTRTSLSLRARDLPFNTATDQLTYTFDFEFDQTSRAQRSSCARRRRQRSAGSGPGLGARDEHAGGHAGRSGSGTGCPVECQVRCDAMRVLSRSSESAGGAQNTFISRCVHTLPCVRFFASGDPNHKLRRSCVRIENVPTSAGMRRAETACEVAAASRMF